MRWLASTTTCLVLLVAAPAYSDAETSDIWFSVGGDEKNVAIIQDCLVKNKDTQLCKSVTLDFGPTNGEAYGYQATSTWSVIGQRLYDSAIKKHPEMADLLKKSQLAWLDYAKKQCDWFTKSATYDDDDAEGNHPHYYDGVTYRSCTTSMTVDRVIVLFQKAH